MGLLSLECEGRVGGGGGGLRMATVLYFEQTGAFLLAYRTVQPRT